MQDLQQLNQHPAHDHVPQCSDSSASCRFTSGSGGVMFVAAGAKCSKRESMPCMKQRQRNISRRGVRATHVTHVRRQHAPASDKNMLDVQSREGMSICTIPVNTPTAAIRSQCHQRRLLMTIVPTLRPALHWPWGVVHFKIPSHGFYQALHTLGRCGR